MKLLYDYMFPASLIVVLGFVGYQVWNHFIKPEDLPDNTNYVQIDEHTGQSSVTGGNTGGANVSNQATYQLGGQNCSISGNGINSSGDKYYEISLQDGLPLGYIKISRGGKIEGYIYKNEINVKTKLYKEKNQYKIINTASSTLKEIGNFSGANKEWLEKPYPLKIINAESQVQLESNEKNKIVFAFLMDVGLNGTYVIKSQNGDIIPNLGFSLLGYGNSVMTKYRFLRIGVGARNPSNGINVSVSPFMYNLGNSIKFIHNTFIGPIVGYDKREINVGAGLALTF